VSTKREVLLLITAKNTQMVVSEPDERAMRVPVEIRDVKSAHKGTSIDNDFEHVENEVGMFLGFCCHGDSAVRRFLYSRSIIDAVTCAPKEHEWTIECDEAGKTRAVAFRGRLYNYDECAIGDSEAVVMRGRIRIAD